MTGGDNSFIQRVAREAQNMLPTASGVVFP
jgi:hypothetical protein